MYHIWCHFLESMPVRFLVGDVIQISRATLSEDQIRFCRITSFSVFTFILNYVPY